MKPVDISRSQRLPVRFVGEQDGPPEQELKLKLLSILRENGLVARAYLAKVAYRKKGDISVALCLSGEVSDRTGLVRDIAEVFAKQFGTDQHLDIVFLTAEDEKRLAVLCKPFFNRAEPN